MTMLPAPQLANHILVLTMIIGTFVGAVLFVDGLYDFLFLPHFYGLPDLLEAIVGLIIIFTFIPTTVYGR